MPKSNIPEATVSASSSMLLKDGSGLLYGLNLATGAAGGWFLLLDDNATPSNGAARPKRAWAVGANSSLELAFPTPLQFAKGATVVFSTTGPYSITLSSTAFIAGEVA